MATVLVQPGTASLGSISAGDSLYVLGGNANIVTNVDQSGLGASAIVVVEVAGSYTGVFASDGAPFKAQITTRLVYAAQTGTMSYQAAGNSNTCALIQIIGGGDFHGVAGGTTTRVEQLSGTSRFDTAFVITNARFSGGASRILDATTTALTLLQLDNGKNGSIPNVYNQRAATTITANAGNLTLDTGTNAVGTLNCNGARVKITTCGTITTLNATSSVPDCTQMSQPMTITNTTINCDLPGASQFLDNPLITFTNAATRIYSDGRLT